MLEEIKGQKLALTVLSKLLLQHGDARTLLFLGPRGCGKMTSALKIARILLERDPFISPDISIYRNDSYGLKTRYFLRRMNKGVGLEQVTEYFSLLLNRFSQAVYLDEFSREVLSKYKVQAFRTEFEEQLLNHSIDSWVKEKGVVTRLEELSDVLSKKQRVPIRQIRNLIEFHQYHSDSPYRISILGDFDQATEEAQNAALKLFEEPSPNNLIILTATSVEDLLPTILSRSLIIKFKTLTPSVINEITGREGNYNYKNTIELMQDEVYGYREKRRKNLQRFFVEIAPRVQYEFKLFEFIDELVLEKPEFLKLFLEDLSEIFRDILIRRNELLRKTDLSEFVTFPQFEFTRRIVKRAVTSEIHSWVLRLEEEINGLHIANLTPRTFLPSLLTDLARWYQIKMK